MIQFDREQILTEEQWLRSGDPSALIELLAEHGSARRWRLFACHCCWRILPLLSDRSREAVSLAEQLAEGVDVSRQNKDVLNDVRAEMLLFWQNPDHQAQAQATRAAESTLTYPLRTHLYVCDAIGPASAEAERVAQCHLLRDLFANPFRPFVIDRSWLHPTVRSLAEAIYAQELFDQMPILGDALEDSGCDNRSILDHCRASAAHYRGCWVLDALLGKA